MQVAFVAPLLIAVIFLAFFGGSNGECCTDLAKLTFIISGGTCAQVNADSTPYGCEVTICGDGKAIVGTFCGRGPCNIFGCNCDGGCLHGDFAQTFLARNNQFSIQLMRTEMTTASETVFNAWGVFFGGKH